MVTPPACVRWIHTVYNVYRARVYICTVGSESAKYTTQSDKAYVGRPETEIQSFSIDVDR